MILVEEIGSAYNNINHILILQTYEMNMSHNTRIRIYTLIFLGILFKEAWGEIDHLRGLQQKIEMTHDTSSLDHISMTKEAAELRSQHLRKKKPFMKKSISISSLLFPGTTPQFYSAGEHLPILAELVESRKTQLPVKYFQIPSMCAEPSKAELATMEIFHKLKRKNLGQQLMGSQATKMTKYSITVGESQTCVPLCERSLVSKDVKFLRRLIDKQYRVHLTLDSLPVLVRSKTHNYALRGFPIGFKRNGEYYLYNHLKFVIYYKNANAGDTNDRSIVITGFDVIAVSIDHDTQACSSITEPLVNRKDSFLKLPTENNDFNILSSYEVEWESSDIEWADRWDIYMMETPDNEVHYFAIVNSLMIGLFLSGIVAVIMIRALRKDIAQYNDLADEPVEESGWKNVHGDVFRPPRRGRMILSVCVGTGVQIGLSIFLTLSAAALRLLSPMKKGQMLSYIVILYVLSGSAAGYSSARLYKYCLGKSWKRTTLLTASAFPGVLLTTFALLNFFLHISLGKASTAVSLTTMVLVFVLWVCVSAPLVFVGAYFGYRADRISVPTKTNQIARFVPDSNSWFVKVPHCALLAGILPFGSICIELSFIMNALWINQIYYIMGFITVVVIVFTIACSTTSMVMCYCQLCNEDYKWWWKSFLNGASTGFYLFLYSLWYLVFKLELVGFLSIVVYISYMGIICFAFSLYSGAIGVFSAFWFCRKIYGAVKVD